MTAIVRQAYTGLLAMTFSQAQIREQPAEKGDQRAAQQRVA